MRAHPDAQRPLCVVTHTFAPVSFARSPAFPHPNIWKSCALHPVIMIRSLLIIMIIH